MPFPQRAGTNNSADGTATTSHTVNLPAGIVAGETLVVAFSVDTAPVVTFPDGWTKVYEQSVAQIELVVAYKKAVGDEGASITVTTDLSRQSVHVAWRISGAADPTVSAPEASAEASGYSTAPNPASLTSSGGSKQYMWIAVTGYDDGRTTLSVYPYADNNEQYQSANSSSGCGVGICSDEVETDTQDPGAFTISSSEVWEAATICIYPAVAGGWTNIASIRMGTGEVASADMDSIWMGTSQIAVADVSDFGGVAV